MSINDIYDGTWEKFEEFIEYMNKDSEDKKYDVTDYLWNNCSIFNASHTTISMFLDIFKDSDYEIIGEDKLDELKDVRVLRR